MLVTLESHQSRTTAERARQAFIKAQRLVDAVWLKITGELVQPPAEETYTVFMDNGEWVVGFYDPSLFEERVEVSSTDERNVYDCGD